MLVSNLLWLSSCHWLLNYSCGSGNSLCGCCTLSRNARIDEGQVHDLNAVKLMNKSQVVFCFDVDAIILQHNIYDLHHTHFPHHCYKSMDDSTSLTIEHMNIYHFFDVSKLCCHTICNISLRSDMLNKTTRWWVAVPRQKPWKSLAVPQKVESWPQCREENQ